MEDKKLNTMNALFDEITIEAKTAFMEKFPYLKTLCTVINANQIVREVSDTNDSILIGLSCTHTVPFSIIEKILFDKDMMQFNYELGYVYDKNKITLTLKKFYYHTKMKIIYSIHRL